MKRAISINMEVNKLDDIKLYIQKEINLEGATVINGFPTAGLVSTIAANYLIETFKLDQIAFLDSPMFPPISMIYNSKPKFPARIYGDKDTNLVVFISEFTPMINLIRPIVNTIFDFIDKNHCSIIIAPEAMPAQGDNSEIFGVGSTDSARSKISKQDIKFIPHGIITGITGVMLNEGKRRNFDVITLLAQARSEMPDARAAAMIIEKISKLINIKIDIDPLYNEAEKIEKRIKGLREQSKSATKPSTNDMYI